MMTDLDEAGKVRCTLGAVGFELASLEYAYTALLNPNGADGRAVPVRPG